MANPRYDYKGDVNGAFLYIKRAVHGTRSDDEIRFALSGALSSPGSAIPVSGVKGAKDIEIVAVSTEHGMRLEVTLR